jgi:hypothetical protein
MIDDMSDERRAAYVAWANLRHQMVNTAGNLAVAEAESPGTLASISTLPAGHASDIVWRMSGVDGTILRRDGEWLLSATPSYPAGATPVTVTICRDTGAPPVDTNGHCPVTMLCETCQWQEMTPGERSRVAAGDAARRERHRCGVGIPRRQTGPAPAGPADEPLADWERELVEQDTPSA